MKENQLKRIEQALHHLSAAIEDSEVSFRPLMGKFRVLTNYVAWKEYVELNCLEWSTAKSVLDSVLQHRRLLDANNLDDIDDFECIYAWEKDRAAFDSLPASPR
jgi:hypothetical protein